MSSSEVNKTAMQNAKYTKKQIKEALRRWTNELRKLDEAETVPAQAGGIQKITIPPGVLYGHGIHVYDAWYVNTTPVEFIPVSADGITITVTIDDGTVAAVPVRPGKCNLKLGNQVIRGGRILPNGEYMPSANGDSIAFIDECADSRIEKYYYEIFKSDTGLGGVLSDDDVFSLIASYSDVCAEYSEEAYNMLLEMFGGFQKLHAVDVGEADILDKLKGIEPRLEQQQQ